ncbi:MAG: lipid-A-disaccharide synthase-related protein [Candidatus Sericytochromatia bacterium]|nr:lipid-A-disaccharide synthase-related protein [Candidatus Sericytochromatia bacterium]
MPEESVLWLSNGHGEDRIAKVLLSQDTWGATRHLAFPLVGEGLAYREAGVPVMSPIRVMPSGGFILREPGVLRRDLAHGLVQLTFRQLLAIRGVAASASLVVAIGDILPLVFAYLTGRPYVFVSCAKSDYYRPLGREDHLAIERFFMTRSHCLAVYPRDRLTARSLQDRGIHAHDFGNPMMDDLELSSRPWPGSASGAVLGLLPGSRRDAPMNFPLLLQAAMRFLSLQHGGEGWSVAVAVASGISIAELAHAGCMAGWSVREEGGLLSPAGHRLDWIEDRFGDWVRRVDLVFGMAGTAIEQCAGFGVPVVTFPGPGPQFSVEFAKAQARLLGRAVRLTSGPEAAAREAVEWLSRPSEVEAARAEGLERMGRSGAASRLVTHMLQVSSAAGRGTSI